jgi:hypothetical protein
MNKTLIWVLVGALAVAGVAAVALVGFRPHKAATAAAASTTVTPSDAQGSSVSTPAAMTPAIQPVSQSTTDAAPVAAEAQPAAAARLANPTVDELIQSAALYEGQPVVLRGTILTQCTAGCEFALDDGTGALSVQLEGKGKDRLIPLNKVGKKIEVSGTFHASPRPQVVIEDPNGWQFVK